MKEIRQTIINYLDGLIERPVKDVSLDIAELLKIELNDGAVIHANFVYGPRLMFWYIVGSDGNTIEESMGESEDEFIEAFICDEYIAYPNGNSRNFGLE